MHFLIVSDISDIFTQRITHYSLDKGLNLGIGLLNNGCKVDYVINGETQICENIKYINYMELSEEKINLYNYVIVVREGILETILNEFTELKKVFFSENKITKIIIKSDSCNWVYDKNFRKYISKEKTINGSIPSVIRWINSNINYICVQNKEYYEKAIQNGIKKNILLISNMSVPSTTIDYDNMDDPYKEDYSYCKKKTILMPGDALFPLYDDKNEGISGEEENININTTITAKKKIKIIYIGRIKTDQGKIIYIMKEIIEKLGDDFELHIFPGSFMLFDEDTNTIQNYSANNVNHLEHLRNTIFPNFKNVFIHRPFNNKDIHRYLWYADIGIDFSSSRPNDIKADAGNAKLLEYCYMGLPVVTESNVNNSFLVNNCKNGILLDGIGSVNEYVNAIKLLSSLNIDRKNASMLTIQNENWDLRAKQFLDDLNKS